MLFEGAIEVHHLLSRCIEAGEELVADNNDLRVVLLFIPADDLLLLCPRDVIGSVVLLVVVHLGDEDCRVVSAKGVERLLIPDSPEPVGSNYLGLETVGLDPGPVVFEQVLTDPPDPFRGDGDGGFSDILPHELRPLFLGVAGKEAL